MMCFDYFKENIHSMSHFSQNYIHLKFQDLFFPGFLSILFHNELFTSEFHILKPCFVY
jgi:hypothetical protein